MLRATVPAAEREGDLEFEDFFQDEYEPLLRTMHVL